MDTLKQDERIPKAEAVKKVVADTNFNGEADVEFQLEISAKKYFILKRNSSCMKKTLTYCARNVTIML